VDNVPDLSVFDGRFSNDETGAPAWTNLGIVSTTATTKTDRD
jgi:hypothetical protein